MIEELVDRLGEAPLLMVAGALVGLLFGVTAQHSRFCLRAATVEVAEGRIGGRMAVWLIVFFSALSVTQGAILAGVLDVSSARQLAAAGSVSGAVAGGLMFGAGMILARGCASRLLVLSGTGNLRALITGLVLTLVAQASYRGVLAPAREALSSLWLVDGGAARSLLDLLGLGRGAVVAGSLLCLAGALALGGRHRIGLSRMLAAIGVGAAVTLGWVFTYWIATASFEIVPVGSVTFTGPATDTLMAFVNDRSVPMSFGIGLVPGVFVGSAAMALAAGEWRLERFGEDVPMERYLLGAGLMGFGAMLAGGCAVGAGVSGGAILSATAWLALFAMWVGAMATHVLLVQKGTATRCS